MREVVHLDAHVLDAYSAIEGLPRVNPRPVRRVQDMSDPHPLQTGLVHCH